MEPPPVAGRPLAPATVAARLASGELASPVGRPSGAGFHGHSPQEHGDAGALRPGARVEALFEGRWYAGELVGLPHEDEDGQGRWEVRCDVDPEGVYTYVTDVRPVVGTTADVATGAATAAAAAAAASAAAREPRARALPEPGLSGSGSLGAAGDAGAADVVVTKAFLADGCEYFMVFDEEGKELGSFDVQRHLDFELNAGAELVRHWLQGLPTALLPGLLALLVEAAETGGQGLTEARERLDALHSPEDYLFFGLAPGCSDQDLERAYRRLCARLHPDKGGDEASFAAMRQRYERLKSLRGRTAAGGSEGAGGGRGAGADSGAGGGGDEGQRRRGEISWDVNSRASMLSAHEELRLQLLWIAEQTRKVERDVAELRRRQDTRYCLADRPAADAATDTDLAAGGSSAAASSAISSHAGVPATGGGSRYAAAAGGHARHDFGACLLCLEPIPADPRCSVNLCSADPPCQCLLHVHCFLDRQQGMNDHLRRCMICKRPSDPELVRKAVLARERGLR